jgi:hypothetical protein
VLPSARQRLGGPALIFQPNESCYGAGSRSLFIKKYFRGERTAQALESNLTNLEKKIDDLLASMHILDFSFPLYMTRASFSEEMLEMDIQIPFFQNALQVAKQSLRPMI